ncbi:MAG: BatD family protein [Nitrospinota bacterium]
MRLRNFFPHIAAAVCLIILVATPNAMADVKLSLRVDRDSVSPSEVMQLELTVSGSDAGSASEPEIEGLEEFEVIGKSSGTQIYVTGLTLSRSTSYSYSLRPLTSGATVKLRAKVTEGGKEYLSNVVEVELVKSSGKSTPTPAPLPRGIPFPRGVPMPRGGLFGFDDPFFGGRGQKSYREDDFLVQTSVNSKTVYAGQEVVYHMDFYRAINLWTPPRFTLPDVKGFWSVKLDNSERKKTSSQTVGGRQYMVTRITMLLYPLAAGRVTIGEGSVHFQPEPFSSELHLQSKPVEIEVLPLPDEGKPPDYTGLVGSFSIKERLKETSAKQGEPLTLTVSISGKGNLYNIPKPAAPNLDGFELYEPETADEFVYTANGGGGSRNFTYILIPKKAGKLSIGKFASNYFDPVKKEYFRIATNEIKLVVKAGEKSAAAPALETRREVEILSSGIKYIKPDVTELKEEGIPYYTRPIFYIYPALVILTLISFQFYMKRRRRLAADSRRMRRLNAKKLAEKRFQRAGQLLEEGSQDLFFGEMAQGLRQFLADKCDIEEAGFTTEEISGILSNVNGSAGLDKRFATLLEECNMARFAPGERDKREMQKLLEEASAIVDELEKKL